MTLAEAAAHSRNVAGIVLLAASIGGAVLERGFDAHIISDSTPGTLAAAGIVGLLSLRAMNQHDKYNTAQDAAVKYGEQRAAGDGISKNR